MLRRMRSWEVCLCTKLECCQHPYVLILSKEEIFNSCDHFDDSVYISPALLVQRGRYWPSVWNPETKRLLYCLTRTDISHWSRPRSVIYSSSQGAIWHHFKQGATIIQFKELSGTGYHSYAGIDTLSDLF